MRHKLLFILTACLFFLTGCKGSSNESDSSLEYKWTSSASAEASSVEEESSDSESSDLLESIQQENSGNTVTSNNVSKSNNASSKTGSQIPSVSSKAAASQTPPQVSVRVTVPEGYSFMQTAKLLEQKGVCTAADFYKAAQDYRVSSFTIPRSDSRCFSLEGYLYPDSYDFYKGEDPLNVIRKMLNNYAAKSGMPSDETLILASIIEKEARTDKNMRMVSSVFKNRLAKGMKLEADSTREYINKYVTGNKLLPEQSKYAAVYNTYKCAKLPAGPICSPGARAIAAAKNPENSDYLFFFFGNDNDNHYSVTLQEHEEKMAQFGVRYN